MPTYQFEAMDATGQEIKDEIEATNEEEAVSEGKEVDWREETAVRRSESADESSP